MSSSVFASLRNSLFYIAEIGGNHEGDFALAQEQTRLALSSGADAVKFQLYTGDTLVSRIESPDRNAHFKRFQLTRDQYLALAEMCRTAGRIFMASVWDAELFEWIEPHLSVLKVGSGDLTCYPLLARFVATGKPLILSTGLATMDEVRQAVQYISRREPSYIQERKLALLQCTSSYPTPDADANILAMLALQEEFGLPIGYSDHTEGSLAVELAAALGAEIVEKHFTDRREGRTFRDHRISLTCDEVADCLERLRRIKVLRGRKSKELTPSEREASHHVSFRRSIYAARDIAQGEELSADNLALLRPAHGIPAMRFEMLLGRRARRPLRTHEALREDDFE